MRFLSIFISLIISLNITPNNRLDSLLRELDKTIENRKQYTDQKEHQIANLKQQLAYATIDEQRFSLTEQLFNLYGNYQTDTAFHLAKQRLELASRIEKPEMIAMAKMNMAEVFRTTGMYKESLELLDEVNSEKLKSYNEHYYFHLRHSLYILLAEYAIDSEGKKKYNALVFNYKDSILSITPNSDMDFYLVNSTRKIMLGEYDKALEFMQTAYATGEKRAMVAYTLSEIYRHLGDWEKVKIYLTESAIDDMKSGVKEYISLQELASLLFKDGDIDRAYSYVKTSMEDAIFSNARLRALEISRMLPIINETYDIKIKQEKDRLFNVFLLTITLAVILSAALLYIYRQVKKLAAIRKYQKKMNVDLKEMNEELNSANSELRDANIIKEEYIGYLFNICSSYIDKLENYRVTVNRKIKAGQINELNKMTSSSSLVADELKEFYKNFDTVFLNLYPTFVGDFNALLPKDGKIEPKEGDLLTPELRIYALVKLGISDSVKIADFLHYSPQTIYNYRLKIRNKIIISKEDFATALAKIGLSKHS